MACLLGREDLVAELVRCGADVNVADIDGDRPLHVAAGLGSLSCLNLLLRAGARVNTVNEDGYTALHWACRYGHGDCIESLLSAGADWTIKDNWGNTPEDIAWHFGHHDVWETAFHRFEEKRDRKRRQERKRRKRRRGQLMLEAGELEALFEDPPPDGSMTSTPEEDQKQHQSNEADKGDIKQAAGQARGLHHGSATNPDEDGPSESQASGHQHDKSTGGTGLKQRGPAQDHQHPLQSQPKQKNSTSLRYLVVAVSALMVLLSLAFTTKTAQTIFLSTLAWAKRCCSGLT